MEKIIVAGLAVVSLVLLITGRARIDAVGLALVGSLVLTGILDLGTALGGFSNPTVVTLAGLYVIGEALTRTGAFDFVTRSLLKAKGGGPTRLIVILCYTAAFLSAIASDTAVVLVFIPIAARLSRDLKIPLSRILMPLAFSSILGGTVTLVGSSINLLTSGSAQQSGAEAFGFFTMTPVGLPLTLVGVPLVVWLTGRLLPDRQSLTSALASTPNREYVTEVSVGPESPWIGKTVREATEARGVRALFLVRKGRIVWLPIQEEVVAEGDVLMLQGDVTKLAELTARQGVQVVEDTRFDPQTMHLIELGVTPGSHLVGRRIRDLPLWRDYRVLAVAVLRGRQHVRKRMGNMFLRHGDLLLVCGDQDAQERLQGSSDFHLLLQPSQPVAARKNGPRALAILAGIIAGFTLMPLLGWEKLVPIPIVALVGAMVMIWAGCLTPRRAYRAIDWPVLILVAGALALGKALEKTGLAEQAAQLVVAGTQDYGAAVALSGLLLVGTLLNQFTSPYAVAVLLTPIAIATANSLGVDDPTPFLVGIALAGSNAFATPLGHQVNLMVLGPGGYEYRDFLRVGLPMCLFYWLFASAALAIWL